MALRKKMEVKVKTARPLVVVIAGLGLFAFWLSLSISSAVAGGTQAQAQSITPTSTSSSPGSGVATTVALPTPTPPSEEVPNLHLLITDAAGQPQGGVKLNIYSYLYNQQTSKYDLKLVFQGQTNPATSTGTGNAAPGWASFDATTVLHGLFYVDMHEGSDNALILPTDPNGPRVGTGGLPDPQVANMSMLDLFEGSVVYVFTYQLRPLVAGSGGTGSLPALTPLVTSVATSTPTGGVAVPPRRAVFVAESKRFIYYTQAGSGLSQVSTVTPAPTLTALPPTRPITPNPSSTSNGGIGGTTASSSNPIGTAGSLSATPTPLAPNTAVPPGSNSKPGGNGYGITVLSGGNNPSGGPNSGLLPTPTPPGGSSSNDNGNSSSAGGVVVTTGDGSSNNSNITTSASGSSNSTSECRYCVPVGGSAEARATAIVATAQAQVSAGIYTPASGSTGRNREIGDGPLTAAGTNSSAGDNGQTRTPKALGQPNATQGQGQNGTGTVVALNQPSATNSGSSNNSGSRPSSGDTSSTTNNNTSTSNSSGPDLVLILLLAVVVIGGLGFFAVRMWKRGN